VHARDWLYSLEAVGIKLGLSQITRLLEALGHPHHAFRSITIAGTNGKGSVTAMVERGLRAAGQRTGRYTSPHLVRIEERVVVNGRPVTVETFDQLAAQVRTAAGILDSPPSFFEATTALALLAFRDARVDTAVLEVGLGGRLDATNAVDAPLVAITAVDLDHQEYLGSTLTDIAREKAGIIKRGATVLAGNNPVAVMSVIRDRSEAVGASFVDALAGVTTDAVVTAVGSTMTLTTPVRRYESCRLRLAGRHQIANAILAVRILETAQPAVPAQAIVSALRDVEWPARLEWLQWQGHDVLLDGAHNPAGARALASFLQEMVGHPVPIVIGVMRDKAAREIVQSLAPAASVLVATAAASPRALPPSDLADLARSAAPTCPVLAGGDPMSAISAAVRHGSPVVVAGSLYLAGEVRHVMVPSA
jgi:dihydrofolate synthase/folylpolyglutamate synthase